MKISGIAVCILAALAAFAPFQTAWAKDADTPIANSSQPAPNKAGAKSSRSKAKSHKKAEPKPAPQSFITFYWPKDSSETFLRVFQERMLISLDGQPAGRLTPGEYITVPVHPGSHTYGYERVVQFSEGETKRTIDVAQGQTVYFEIIHRDEGFVQLVFPQQVAAEVAEAELPKLKLPLQSAPKEAVAAPKGAVAEVSASGAKPAGRSAKAAGQPQAVPQSTITFYWRKSAGGVVAFMDTFKEHFGISIDDQFAGSISEGEYISVPVQPGPHTYSYSRASQISFGEKKHNVDVPPGQSVYFQITEQEQGMVTVAFPEQVPADQAQQALANLKSPEKNE